MAGTAFHNRKCSPTMSGFTPRTPGDEPTGLQDVLAFIADFEMEDSAVNASHSAEDWHEGAVATRPAKAHDADLVNLFVEGGRQATPTTFAALPTGSSTTTAPPFTTVESQPNTSHSPKQLGDEAPKSTRRHRVTRKEELEYLRKKVTDMEDQLKKLKDSSEGSSSPPPPAPSAPDSEQAALQLQQSIALWKKMAERQKSQRDMVESENAKLREKLKTQVRMAKSLQRILRKRERDAEEITEETPKRLRQLPPSVQAVAAMGDFCELVQNLDMLYTLTTDRISLSSMPSASQPVVRERDVKYNDLTGMFIEFQNSRLLPFDLDAVARATWRHSSEPGVKFNTYFEESAETTENMILRKFGVEIKQGERVAKLSGRQAIRRYVERHRVLFVRNSVIDKVELSGATTGGLTFRDAGWVELRDVTGQYSSSGPMTLMLSYATLTPDVDLDSQWEVGALTDFVLQSRGDMEDGNDSIVENMLLEEASKLTHQ